MKKYVVLALVLRGLLFSGTPGHSEEFLGGEVRAIDCKFAYFRRLRPSSDGFQRWMGCAGAELSPRRGKRCAYPWGKGSRLV